MAWMALTCCVTCDTNVVDAFACMAAKVPSERAWNKSRSGSVVSAPRLSGRAGSACDVQAVMRNWRLLGEMTGCECEITADAGIPGSLLRKHFSPAEPNA